MNLKVYKLIADVECRWLTNEMSVNRILQLWEEILLYIETYDVVDSNIT